MKRIKRNSITILTHQELMSLYCRNSFKESKEWVVFFTIGDIRKCLLGVIYEDNKTKM